MNNIFPGHTPNGKSPAGNFRDAFSRPLIHVLLIALLGFLVYSNTFSAPFVLDDDVNIVHNPIIKSFDAFHNISLPSSAHIPPTVLSLFKTRIIGYFTFALNYRLNGLDVAGYHIFNLATHIINALLVYWLIILTFRTPFMSRYRDAGSNCAILAFLTALLFVCHPLQTGAVTYIVQRFASLATMFYLLALVLYINYRLHPEGWTKYAVYILAVSSAVAGMLTKEISFTLPVVIAMYEFMFFEGKIRSRIVPLIPLFLTMTIIPLLLSTIFDSFDSTRLASAGTMSRLEYLFTQFTVLMVYLRLLFVPANQNLDYDYPLFHSLFDPTVFLSLICLILILGLALLFLHRSRVENDDAVYLRFAAFGIFWFFITLSVESSIIPIDDLIFEHRMYLPSVGCFIAVVMTFYLLINRLLMRKLYMNLFVSLFILIIVSLSGAAYARNAVWNSNITLFKDVADKSPLKPRAHRSLGFAYLQQNLIDEAIKELQIAIRLKPDDSDAFNNLGLAYYKASRFDDAIREFSVALKLNQSNPKVTTNLGIAYMRQKRFDFAKYYLEQAIKTNPEYLIAHLNLGLLFETEGDMDKAAQEYLYVSQHNPGIIDIHYYLGVGFINKGDYKSAINKFGIVIKIRPDHAQALYNLGFAYMKQNRLPEAAEAIRNAIRLQPDMALLHYSLGLVYKQQKQPQKAAEELETALKLQPDYGEAQKELTLLRQNTPVRRP
jgi:protein O-mannosyl-transferase